MPVWQRNYYEHIIRDDGSLQRIRVYIAGNPLRWHTTGRAGAPQHQIREDAWAH